MVLTVYRYRDQVGAEDNRLAEGNGSRLPAGDFLGFGVGFGSLGLQVWLPIRLVCTPDSSSFFIRSLAFLLSLLSPVRSAESSRILPLCFPFRKLSGKKNLLTFRGILGGLHTPVGTVFDLGLPGLGWVVGGGYGSSGHFAPVSSGKNWLQWSVFHFHFSPSFPKKNWFW